MPSIVKDIIDRYSGKSTHDLTTSEQFQLQVALSIESGEDLRYEYRSIGKRNPSKIHEIPYLKSIFGPEILYSKEILLTIDDGYVEGITEAYCELICSLKVYAAFFLVGETVDEAVLLRLEKYTEYCSFYIHGYKHINLSKLSNGDLQNNCSLISKHNRIYFKKKVIRLPYGGGYNDPRVLSSLPSDLFNLHWNVNPEDYRFTAEYYETYGAEQISNLLTHLVLQNKSLDKGGIILMHQENDSRGIKKEISFLYIPQLINYLKSFQFDIIDLRSKLFCRN